MRFVWMMSSGGGGVPPQLALCEALVDAGHDVVAVVPSRVAAQAERSGLQVEAFEEPPRPMGVPMAEFEQWVWSEMFLGDTPATALRDAIDRHRPDRVLVDGMSYSAQVEARASGVRYAVLWHTLVDAAEVGGGTGYREAHLAAHNAHRAERALDEVERVHDTLLDADWFLALAYDVLDSPRAREWPNLHYVGDADAARGPRRHRTTGWRCTTGPGRLQHDTHGAGSAAPASRRRAGRPQRARVGNTWSGPSGPAHTSRQRCGCGCGVCPTRPGSAGRCARGEPRRSRHDVCRCTTCCTDPGVADGPRPGSQRRDLE